MHDIRQSSLINRNTQREHGSITVAEGFLIRVCFYIEAFGCPSNLAPAPRHKADVTPTKTSLRELWSNVPPVRNWGASGHCIFG